MKALCHGGAKCVQCRRPITPEERQSCPLFDRQRASERKGSDITAWANYSRAPQAIELTHSDCPHLLGPIGENVKLKGCGCGAMTAVYECNLHQLCAPIPRTKNAEIVGDERGIRFCKDCPDNPANPSVSRPAAV